jgi:Tfp pilus assembly protein PilX
MLTSTPPRCRGQHRDRGVVLFVALIVLIAMTLAGLALLRSVFTSNRVAGNLAFQQAATQSADVGIEAAIAWLEDTNANSPTKLHNHVTVGGGETVGYFALRQDPVPGQSWEQFWDNVLVPTNRVTTLPADAAGNTVSFVIQRLCNEVGDPTTGKGCDTSPVMLGSESSSRGAGVVALQTPGQYYYRITARVAGPRNTVSFVQAIVSM